MKAIRPIIILLLSFLSLELTAQNSPRNFAPGHEVRIGIGAYDPIYFGNLSWGPPDIPDLQFDCLDVGAHIINGNIYQGPTYLTGVLAVGYTYRFRRWFELSGVLTYSGMHSSLYSVSSGKRMGSVAQSSISLLPVARFVWFRTRYVHMYSSVGVGIRLFADIEGMVKSVRVVPSYHVNPVGLAVGRRVYGFAELSFGSLGVLRAGIGVKIGKY